MFSCSLFRLCARARRKGASKTHLEALLHGGVAVVDELVLLEARHGDLFGGGRGAEAEA